jgi:hypothetical protein
MIEPEKVQDEVEELTEDMFVDVAGGNKSIIDPYG